MALVVGSGPSMKDLVQSARRRVFTSSVPLPALGVVAVTVLLAFLHSGRMPPLRVTVALFFGTLAIALWRIRISPESLLARAALVFYVAPFLPTVAYLFVEHFYWWPRADARALQDQPQTLEIMTALGFVGLLGLIAGMVIAGQGPRARPRHESLPSLGAISYVVALAVAFGLSWLNTPPETILVARYAVDQTTPLAITLRFNSAYLVAYILLCLLLVDADLEAPIPPWRRLKLLSWLAVTGYIVVVHQVLRGDRECAGLLAGALAYYVASARPDARRRRLVAAASLAVTVVVIFSGLQVTRWTRRQQDLLSPSTAFEGASHGTWTAVLLTDLSMAERVRVGRVEYQFGRTYWDYVLSLPPGFVADAIGWKRPIEADHGPAWLFADVSAGGCHLPLVPFWNFGWAGVFLILAFYGWSLGRIDGWMAEEPGRGQRFVYAATFTFLPLWFWYGDLYGIRGVMIIALWWGGYRTLVLLRSSLAKRRG